MNVIVAIAKREKVSSGNDTDQEKEPELQELTETEKKTEKKKALPKRFSSENDTDPEKVPEELQELTESRRCQLHESFL